MEAEVTRLTKESTLQAPGPQPLGKEEQKKKAAATKVGAVSGVCHNASQRGQCPINQISNCRMESMKIVEKAQKFKEVMYSIFGK